MGSCEGIGEGETVRKEEYESFRNIVGDESVSSIRRCGRTVMSKEAEDSGEGTFSNVEEESPLVVPSNLSGTRIFTGRFRKRVAPEEEELREMKSNKVGTEGHEGGNENPSDLNFDS